MPDEMTLLLWALVILQAKHFLADFVLAPRYGLLRGDRYFLYARAVYALLHAVGSFPAILLLSGWNFALPCAFVAELVLVYHLAWGRQRLVASGLAAGETDQMALSGAEQLLHQLFYLAVLAPV